MRAALVLATLAELCRPCFLWDSFSWVPRSRMLLGTSLGAIGGRWHFRCICLETRGCIDKKFRKKFSKIKNLKYGNCRYEHDE
jgi:hypothetical protein